MPTKNEEIIPEHYRTLLVDDTHWKLVLTYFVSLSLTFIIINSVLAMLFYLGILTVIPIAVLLSIIIFLIFYIISTLVLARKFRITDDAIYLTARLYRPIKRSDIQSMVITHKVTDGTYRVEIKDSTRRYVISNVRGLGNNTIMNTPIDQLLRALDSGHYKYELLTKR